MKTIRAVFFDAVGTVLFPEPSPARVYCDLARELGVELDEMIVRKRILKSYQAQELLDLQTDGQASETGERTRWFEIVKGSLSEVTEIEACFERLWEHYRHPIAWRVHPEAAETFASLQRQNLTLGLASNFDARLGALVSAMPELAPLRDRVLISSLVGWRKPSRKFFEAVIQQAGCKPEEILFVGDDLRNDYEGARDAGMQSLLLDPEGKQQKIRERIASLADLIDWLNAN